MKYYGSHIAILFQLSIYWTYPGGAGKCVTAETVHFVVVVITQNSVHGIPRSSIVSQQIHNETELNPNLGSSKFQQLKPDTLLGLTTNDL